MSNVNGLRGIRCSWAFSAARAPGGRGWGEKARVLEWLLTGTHNSGQFLPGPENFLGFEYGGPLGGGMSDAALPRNLPSNVPGV